MPDTQEISGADVSADPGAAATPPENEPLRFQEGDAIVHPAHGAGRVTAIQSWEVGGIRRRYYSIELVSDHGILMIPVEQAEEIGLRPAVKDPDDIFDVLAEQPQELDGDHRKRQADLTEKIHSGDAGQISEALRDLAWRERSGGLTERDHKLKAEAEALLAGELALQPDLTLDTAVERLLGEVSDAIEAHAPPEDDETDTP